jgi:hypothetical protein
MYQIIVSRTIAQKRREVASPMRSFMQLLPLGFAANVDLIGRFEKTGQRGSRVIYGSSLS